MAAPIRSDELLATACFRGEVDRVRDMLDHGAATNARGEHMTSAMHWAVSMGHVEVAEVCWRTPCFARMYYLHARSGRHSLPCVGASRHSAHRQTKFPPAAVCVCVLAMGHRCSLSLSPAHSC